jgi:hypothetical protein
MGDRVVLRTCISVDVRVERTYIYSLREDPDSADVKAAPEEFIDPLLRIVLPDARYNSRRWFGLPKRKARGSIEGIAAWYVETRPAAREQNKISGYLTRN